MPAIADQVTTLENDHAIALATIDSLRSANSALSAQLADMQTHVDNVKAMVESIASGALKMLQIVAVDAKAIPSEVMAGVAAAVVDVKTDVAGAETKVESAFGLDPILYAPLSATAAPVDNSTPAALFDVAAAPDAERVVGKSPLLVAPYAGVLPSAVSVTPVAAPTVQVVNPPQHNMADHPSILANLETEIEKIPAAVDRMLHHSSAATTLMRDLEPTLVDHTSEGLPIFLRRDTVFQREGRPTT